MTARDFPTLTERNAARVAFLHAAVATLRNRLREYAGAHGGRFLLYGSAARGEPRFDSDVGVLIDFPEDRLSDAWRFAEDACRELGPLAGCRDEFAAHISKDEISLE